MNYHDFLESVCWIKHDALGVYLAMDDQGDLWALPIKADGSMDTDYGMLVEVPELRDAYNAKK